MAASELDARKLISIDGATVVLDPNQDVDELQRRLEQAIEHPQFVQISAANGTDLRFLMSAQRQVTIAVVPPWVTRDAAELVDIDAIEDFDL